MVHGQSFLNVKHCTPWKKNQCAFHTDLQDESDSWMSHLRASDKKNWEQSKSNDKKIIIRYVDKKTW